jgi:membrane protease YdiL (CAAX protease family)
VSGELAAALLQLLLPLAGSALLLHFARRRDAAWRARLGFITPNRAHFMLWIALWLAWLAVSEATIRVFQLNSTAPSLPLYPWYLVALRVLTIGFAAPFLEELFFRGWLLERLARTSFLVSGAVLATAVLSALIYVRLGFGTVFLTACGGVILGLARVRGRSLWIPITLHAMGNWLAIHHTTWVSV